MDRLLRYFAYKHLPERLQSVSRPFSELAQRLVERCDIRDQDGPNETDVEEMRVALRKLLEAKDAAVRATV
jgi:hypothetical protein